MMRNGARVGAAVFVLGLWAAGPCAMAVADDAVTDSPSSGATTSRSAQSPAPATPASRGRRVPTAAGPQTRTASARNRPAAAVTAAPSLSVAAPAASASAPVVAVSAAATSGASLQPRRRSVAVPPVSTIAAAPAAPTASATPADPLHAINAAVAGLFDSAQNLFSGLPGGPVSDLLSGALLLVRRTLLGGLSSAPQISASAVAAASGVATPMPSSATIAVTEWFGSTWNWLGAFDNPLAAALQGALVQVQRTLFSPAPTVKPVQYTSWNAGDPILGALEYIQPGGAAVSFQVTQAPSSGTVQLLSDGTYTYTPGAGFTGTDSFTAQVTAGGFNLLEPSAPRTATVTVNINPTPPVLATKGFDITNLSGQAVLLTEIQKESGYESSVDSKPVGRILQIGETHHVELTFWAFYGYQTNFVFKPCVDVICAGGSQGALVNSPWTVGIRLSTPSSDPRWGYQCGQGDCTNGNGTVIGPSNGWNYNYQNSIKLLDPANTHRTLTGDQAQNQAKALNAVCSTGGSFCQFAPTADAQYTTKSQQVYRYANNTQDNQTVNQGSSETISATSSFGTTYSTEVSATFGQKDVFNFVAKQTFTSTQSLSNTTQRTTNWAVNTTVRPGYVLTTTVDVPVVRVTGDYTAVIGNTTYNLTGVYFDFIDPNAPSQMAYNSTTVPISAG